MFFHIRRSTAILSHDAVLLSLLCYHIALYINLYTYIDIIYALAMKAHSFMYSDEIRAHHDQPPASSMRFIFGASSVSAPTQVY